MIKVLFKIATLCLLSVSLLAHGDSIEEHQFKSAEQEQTYQALIKELRCLVCQNQNLADSNADLAKDLRSKTYQMVIAGKSRKQIVAFMTERYGDFVMYRPPIKATTVLLWFGPFVFLILAFAFAFMVLKKRGAIATDSVAGLQCAKTLLKDE